MRWVAALLAAIVAALPANPAAAQTYEQDRRSCVGAPDADLRVAGCTAVIQAGREAGAALGFAYNNRGLAYDDKGEYDRAIEDFDQAIRLDPTAAETFNNRGVARSHKGQFDRAIGDYDQAIALDPGYAEAYSNRGSALGDKGQYDRAIRDFDRAIELQPDNAFAYNNRGVIYGETGRYDRAVEDFDVAIKLNSSYAEALNNRGIAKRKLGDTIGGNADIAKAKEMITNGAQ